MPTSAKRSSRAKTSTAASRWKQGSFYEADGFVEIPTNSPAYPKNYWPSGLHFRVKNAGEAIRIAKRQPVWAWRERVTNDKSEQELFIN